MAGGGGGGDLGAGEGGFGGGRSGGGGYYGNGRWVGGAPFSPGARFIPGGGGGGGGGAGGGGGGARGGAQQTITAQTPPELDALLGRYKSYLGDLEGGTGQIMDIAGSRLRDAREGGKRSLIEGNIAAGMTGGGNVADYEAETQRGVAGVVSDIALGRQDLLGQMILGGTSLASRPYELALQEKGLSQQAIRDQAAINAQQQELNTQALMAMLQATRSSPLYGGAAMPGLAY